MALPFLPVLYIEGFLDSAYPYLYLLAAASAALSIILLNLCFPEIKRKGLLLLLFCFGILLSLITGRNAEPPPFYTGIPVDSVTEFNGILEGDSIKLKGGRGLFRVMLSSVKSGGRTEADAFGGITVISSGNGDLAGGVEVSVKSEIISGEDGYIAFAGKGDVIQTGWSSFVSEWRSRLRAVLTRGIDGIGEPASSLFEALFLGTRDDPAAEEYVYFRKSGSIHILALSGLHLGILAGLAAAVFVPLFGKKAAFLLSLLLIVFYIFITGAKPSLLRAAVMFTLYGAAFCFDRTKDPLQILLFSFVILAVSAPASVYTLSFQLSFLALFGIITIGKGLSDAAAPYIPAFLRLPLACSVGAQAATAPILFSVFGVIYPVGLITGMVITPIITLFIWGGILFLFLSPLLGPEITAIYSSVLNHINNILISIVKTASAAPALRLSPAAVRMIYISLLILLFVREIRIILRLKAAETVQIQS